jgi:hypothetical protein
VPWEGVKRIESLNTILSVVKPLGERTISDRPATFSTPFLTVNSIETQCFTEISQSECRGDGCAIFVVGQPALVLRLNRGYLDVLAVVG